MIRTLHECVGRNIVRVQALETSLKTLLPFIRHNEEHCLAGLNERRQQFVRKTLGELAGAFADCNQTPSDEFTTYLAKIVNNRNNLVHHFGQIYGAAAAESVNGCREVIGQLDNQFKEIKELERIANEMLLEILQALRDVTFAGTDTYKDFAALCQELKTALAEANNVNRPKPPSASV